MQNLENFDFFFKIAKKNENVHMDSEKSTNLFNIKEESASA